MISENASSATSDQSIVTLPIPFRPYYEGCRITIYHADCRQVLPFLPRFDLLLTDPPYGINASSGIGKYGRIKWTEGDKKWDTSTPPAWLLDAMLEAAEKHIVWGGNYYGLPPSRQYLIWDKGAGFKGARFRRMRTSVVQLGRQREGLPS